MTKTKRYLPLSICLILLICCWANLPLALMQSDQDQDRAIFDSDFLQKRPMASVKPAKARIINYKRVSPKLSSSLIAEKSKPKQPNNTDTKDLIAANNSIVGVTFWRLRAVTANEESDTARILDRVQDDATTELVAERINSDTPLTEGQKVRLTIEVPHSGYIYIIDREKYADGSYSEPYLVFPIKRAKGVEDNTVQAGVPRECPSQEDKNPYFVLKGRRADYVGDALTLLVTPTPLSNLNISNKISQVSQTQFQQWQKEWATEVEINQLVDGAGRVYSKNEKLAAMGTKSLSQDDPLPQTLYRVNRATNEPLLLDLPLNIKK